MIPYFFKKIFAGEINSLNLLVKLYFLLICFVGPKDKGGLPSYEEGLQDLP